MQRRRLARALSTLQRRLAPDEREAEAGRNAWEWVDVARRELDRSAQLLVGAGLLSGAQVEIRAVRDGVEYLLNPSLDLIVLDVIEQGAYSADEVAAVERAIRPSAASRSRGPSAASRSRTTVVNAGANVGTTAIEFARAGWRVIAVEPAARAHELLTLNVKRNDVASRVTVVRAAVTAAAMPVELVTGDNLSTSELRSGNDLAALGTPGDRNLHVEKVDGLPLASVLEAHNIAAEEVALVWSDTEGAEQGVIEGGRDLWRDGVPLWVEIRPNAIRDHGSIRDFVAVVRQNFTHFSTLEDLRDGRTGRSITGFREFVDDVGCGRWDFTNVLLTNAAVPTASK